MIEEGYHHVDENGLGDVRLEPERIRRVHEEEIRTVKEWVKEWDKEKEKRRSVESSNSGLGADW